MIVSLPVRRSGNPDRVPILSPDRKRRARAKGRRSRLAALPVPAAPADVVHDATYSRQATVILRPGTYAGIRASGQSLVVLAPGLYHLTDSVTLSGEAQLSGDNVILHLAPGSSLTVTGRALLTLTPPAAGPYQGVTVLADRRGAAPIVVSGNGDVVFSGRVYAPASPITVSGNGVLQGIRAQVVARTLEQSSTALVDVRADDWNSPPSRGSGHAA